ncbi:hypothetical protein [Sphingomonas crocodyli]|uniref:Uncharacterized protein n=1 Tax=Sphingomonas crocodyli TaxID=1979270 RepID=A0A437LXL2_9SPHN|nr:hypothetical protein [Sphingomonas crocodyli]RVT90151.1 hypothetical protein EOD43_17750 [Sphingomonas crocodyli]
MDFLGHTFIDKVVQLDGHTYKDCTFDGCVVRYDGGSIKFDGTTSFRGENRIEWGANVDATHPFARWFTDKMRDVRRRGLPTAE